MPHLYLIPVFTVVTPGLNYRIPKYFANTRLGISGITTRIAGMDYGFYPYFLAYCPDITDIDHNALITNPDVYLFPDNLDQPVTDPNIDVFFETINIPVDWLTPATTYRELLRNTAGMFQFNQRYGGIYMEIYGGNHSVFDNANLSTRLRQMSAQDQEIFLLTAESFGFNSASINTNSQLRLLVRQAASYWQGKPFILGGFEF